MNLLEAIEFITLQRSAEPAELAQLSALGECFVGVEEAHLLSSDDALWWDEACWKGGGLQICNRQQQAETHMAAMASAALQSSPVIESNWRAYCLRHQQHPQVLLLKTADLLQSDVSALEALLRINENIFLLLQEKNRDRLTGLLNRHQLEEAISLSLRSREAHLNDSEAAEQSSVYDWLAILDIDHFKQVNDNFGHLFGDEVLLLTSRLMVSSFRRQDQLFRYGGEEFVLVLSSLSKAQVLHVLERFRCTLAAKHFPQVGQVTISIGCVAIERQGNVSAVLGEADQALYWSKQNGRNRTAEYQDLLEQGHLKAEQGGGDIDLF